MINWHRLFGLFLLDLFAESRYSVELEKDLSLKQQFLDVVIVRKECEGNAVELPDGFDNLAEHNLLSYKSLREPFDDWTLKELFGHYVNYRKQVSPSLHQLLSESRFRLYGVSTRFPNKLSQKIPLQSIKQGVYELVWGTDTIRLIVLSEIGAGAHNAVWRLFSAKPATVMQARSEYPIHLSEMSTAMQQLFENYQHERIDMSYTLDDFKKEYVLNHLHVLSVDDRLKDLSPDDRVKGLSPDDRLKGLSPEDITAHLSPAELKKLLDVLQKKCRQ